MGAVGDPRSQIRLRPPFSRRSLRTPRAEGRRPARRPVLPGVVPGMAGPPGFRLHRPRRRAPDRVCPGVPPMNVDALFTALGVCVVASPALLLAVLGLTSLLSRPLSEDAMARWTASCVGCGLISALTILAGMLVSGSRVVPLEFGDWVTIPREHFHFHLKFVFDRLSVPFAILTFVLTGTVGTFASRYLHRDPGYGRFFLSFSLFLLGMTAASLAGTIETLFLGWELVGLASALLVAFFHDRSAPVLNAQRVWSVYRLSDAAFLLAAVALHHVSGAGDFSAL